jgi:protein-disulfide isomerase/uncharacterized membrane protein
LSRFLVSEVSTRIKALVALIVCALAGVLDGVYLTLVHLDYETGNVEAASVCHKLAEAGCSVTAGRFGVLLGIPVATIGAAGAATILVLAVAAWIRRHENEDPFRSLTLVMSGFAVVVSAVMASFSAIEGSFCPFCVIWYGINAATFAAAYFARNRGHGLGDLLDDCLGGKGFGALAIFSVLVLGGAFAHHDRRATLLEAREAEMMEHAPEIAAKIVDELLAAPIKPFDSDHLPTQGSEDPEVRIVEFGDFECPHCKKAWDMLEAYLERTDRKVRVRFANFPLDSKCNARIDREIHPHACAAAVAAQCAHRQGKFWEYGGKLFENQGQLDREDLRRHAQEVGLDLAAFTDCLGDPEALAAVKRDIELGEVLQIRATPTSYVNDVEITGALPPPLFDAVVEELLARRPPQ